MEIFPGLPDAIELDLSTIHASGMKLSLFNIASMHPLASGNKLFKLAPNLQHAIENGFSQVLSFGGAFSNHIHALALYGQASGLQTIGIIRGEPEYANNPTLRIAQANGMVLEFVNRKTYRSRNDPDFLQQLSKKYPHTYILPEGGSNSLAVQGCSELGRMINNQSCNTSIDTSIDTIAVACGTGGTLSGLVCGLESDQQVIGFPVVRDTSIEKKIDSLLLNTPDVKYRLIPADYGGYAKFDKDHLDFILDWLEQTGILLDPIYTSKMCRKLMECIGGNTITISSCKHIGLIHTGGLQAWLGMQSRVIKLGGEACWSVISNALLTANRKGINATI